MAFYMYLLLICQVQGFQLSALVGCVDFQQVVKVSSEDQCPTLHQLEHGLQQVLPRMLHLTLQIVKHFIQAVLEEGGTYISCPLYTIRKTRGSVHAETTENKDPK